MSVGTNVETARVLATGDSVVYGRVSPLLQGWVGLLRGALEEGAPASNACFNTGVGGHTSEQVRERIDGELKTFGPELVLIGVGTNDAAIDMGSRKPRVSSRSFAKNLGALLKSVRREGADLMYVGLAPVDESRTSPLGTVNYANQRQEEYQGVLTDFCGSHGVGLIHVWDLFSSPGSPSAVRSELLFDGLHPNDDGHKLISGRVQHEVLPRYGLGQ